MLHIETLNGGKYQTIYLTEHCTTYRDLLQHIKQPIGDEMYRFNPKKPKKYKIYENWSFIFLEPFKKEKIDFDSEIDFSIKVLNIIFRKQYMYINHNGENLYFPDEDKSKVIEIMIRNASLLLQIKYLRPHEYTTSLIKSLVLKAYNHFHYIPVLEIAKYMCKKNISKSIQYFHRLPDTIKTAEFCKIAVQTKGNCIMKIPDKMKTPEICKLAVKYDGILLQYIPDKMKTFEICLCAVEKNSNALKFVPINILNKTTIRKVMHYSMFQLKCEQ